MDERRKLTTRDERLVGDASTLGQTGRSRGVHDAEEVLVLGGVGFDHVILASLAELLVGDDSQVRVLGPEGLDLAAFGKEALLVDDDELDLGILDGLGGRLKQVRVDKHGLGVGLEERVGNAALA